jgi:hypothetical protein
MKYLGRTSAAIAIGLLLVSVTQVQAQTDSQMGGFPMGDSSGQQRGTGQGGRSGFGGGQPVQGVVTAATASGLTLKTDAGDTYTVTVTDTARIMQNRQSIKLADIKVGDSVTAMGTVDAAKKTVQAMMLMDIDAATVAKAKANMGKTYITGKITAVDADNLKLTILRSDAVSQVVAVDDGTSFQRGTRGVAADVVAAGGLPQGGGRGQGGNRPGAGQGAGGTQPSGPPPAESITLADIKVGDSIMATGALKSGVFTVLKMGVSGPPPSGASRRGPSDQPPPDGAPQPPSAQSSDAPPAPPQ